MLQSAYEVFKVNVEKAALEDSVVHDRSAYIEVCTNPKLNSIQ